MWPLPLLAWISLFFFSYKVKENNLDYIFSKAITNVNDPLALQCKWYSHMLSLQRTAYFEFVLFDYFTNDYEQLKLFPLFSWFSGLLLLSLLSFEVVQSALSLFTDQAKYRWIKRLKKKRKTFRRKKDQIFQHLAKKTTWSPWVIYKEKKKKNKIEYHGWQNCNNLKPKGFL